LTCSIGLTCLIGLTCSASGKASTPMLITWYLPTAPAGELAHHTFNPASVVLQTRIVGAGEVIHRRTRKQHKPMINA
jgi:hypothetical protein